MTHVEGDVDPVRDLEIISEELRLKDLQYLANKIVGWSEGGSVVWVGVREAVREGSEGGSVVWVGVRETVVGGQ